VGHPHVVVIGRVIVANSVVIRPLLLLVLLVRLMMILVEGLRAIFDPEVVKTWLVILYVPVGAQVLLLGQKSRKLPIFTFLQLGAHRVFQLDDALELRFSGAGHRLVLL